MKPSEFRRIRRGILDLSQGDLASAMGVSKRTITALENADRDIDTRYVLAIKYLAETAKQPAE